MRVIRMAVAVGILALVGCGGEGDPASATLALNGGVPYQGISAMCAVTAFGTQEMAGPIMKLRGMGVLYHDVTDNPLMTGWLAGTMNQTINTKDGTGVVYGSFVHTPDGLSGTLEDQWLTHATDPVITGAFHGKGDLAGTKVDYQLTPLAPTQIPLDICDGGPMRCGAPGPSPECLGAFCSPSGYCIFAGFAYSGVIHQ